MGEPSTREREPRWLRTMPVLGAAAGAVFGVLVVWVAYVIAGLVAADFDGPVTRVLAVSVVLGVQGALGGLVCGVAVGAVLMVLVGPNRRGQDARRRAATAAALTHALTLAVLMTIIGFGFVGLGTLILVGSTVVAAATAWWFQARLASRPLPTGPAAH